MKRFLKLLFVIVCVSVVLVSCSSENGGKEEQKNQSKPISSQTSSVFYDRNGNAYKEKSEVEFFDEQGNVYYFRMEEDTYLPSYVNAETGEVHDGLFGCFISEDGYIFFDTENKLSRLENSMDTYTDKNGKKYFDPSVVEWDSSGNLVRKAK